METASSSSPRRAYQDITQALACYDAEVTHNPREFRPNVVDKGRWLRRPKFKPLVLCVAPSAVVRRVGGTYECYIGGEHIECRGVHSTPDRAWLCLARFLAAREAKS